MKNLNIPFKIYEKNGVIDITCKENQSVTESGFDILEHIKDKFDLSMCIGYPAELYAAPCNRFKLSWKARTYLATSSEEFNNNTIFF